MQILIYEGKNGTRVDLKSDDFETMWGAVKQLSLIFECETQNIEYHIKQIYENEELTINSTTKEFLVVQNEGNREVERKIKHICEEGELNIKDTFRNFRNVS